MWKDAGPGEADFGCVVGEKDLAATGGDAKVSRAEGGAAWSGGGRQGELGKVDGGLGNALGLPSNADDVEGRCWRG